MSAQQSSEPFPALSPVNTAANAQTDVRTGDTKIENVGRSRASSTASSRASRALRTSSITQAFLNSNPPLGMWQATGEVGSKVPTLPEIRGGSFAAEGWSHEGQMERRGTNPHEIHRRRLARTSSASQRTRGSTIRTPATPGTVAEEGEFFPAMESQEMTMEANRIPTTIKEGQAPESGYVGQTYMFLCDCLNQNCCY